MHRAEPSAVGQQQSPKRTGFRTPHPREKLREWDTHLGAVIGLCGTCGCCHQCYDIAVNGLIWRGSKCVRDDTQEVREPFPHPFSCT